MSAASLFIAAPFAGSARGERRGAHPPLHRFVSLSTETPDAPTLFGPGAAPRAALAQALLNFKALTPGARGGPALRVGGNSGDSSCWASVADSNHSCQHDGSSVLCCTYNITETDLDSYASFAGVGAPKGSVFAELNASFVVTTDLGYGPDAARAAAEVAAITHHRVLPAVSGLEIGNEVASFGKKHGGGHRLYPYTFADYSAEVSEYVTAFRRAAAGTALPSHFYQAAALAHPYDWVDDPSLTMPAFLKAHSSATYSLCIHSYAMTSSWRRAGLISPEISALPATPLNPADSTTGS